MKLYGDVMNRLMENMQPETPQVGMGATELLYSDRHAYTVVEVVNAKVIMVKRDIATCDHRHTSDSQKWQYQEDPKAKPIKLKLHKKGYWYQEGDTTTRFLVGVREEYFDPCF